MRFFIAVMAIVLNSVITFACIDRSGRYEETNGFWVEIVQASCEVLTVEQGHISFPNDTIKRAVFLDGKMRPGYMFEPRDNTTETVVSYRTEVGFQDSHFVISKFEGQDLSWLNIRFDFEFSTDGISLKFIKRTIHQSGKEFPPAIKNLNKK